MSGFAWWGAIALAAWACAFGAQAEDARSLTVGLRLQAWYVGEQGGAADGGTAHDFQLRRAYLSLTGKMSPTVSAFAHVSGDRLGQAGLDAPGQGLGTGIALRDAWIAWQPSTAIRIQAGRMYVPFTRAFGTESTFALLSFDLPQTQGGGRGAIFYPSKVGRDDGVVVWGVPWGGFVQYRLGVMEGVEGAANPGDSLRLAGRLSLNLLDPETTWFNRGTYLGEKRVLAFGLGFDRQPNLVMGGSADRTHEAWTADAFLDLPIARGALTVEASYTDAEGLPQGIPFASVPARRGRAHGLPAGRLPPALARRPGSRSALRQDRARARGRWRRRVAAERRPALSRTRAGPQAERRLEPVHSRHAARLERVQPAGAGRLLMSRRLACEARRAAGPWVRVTLGA